MSRRNLQRLTRYLGFAVLLVGLVLSLNGQILERNSFEDRPNPLEVAAQRSRERDEAKWYKDAGVVVVMVGTLIWIVGSIKRAHRSDCH
jgi:hypothetical protein